MTKEQRARLERLRIANIFDLRALDSLLAAYDKALNALEVIELETRDGGQWGLRDVNEFAQTQLNVI